MSESAILIKSLPSINLVDISIVIVGIIIGNIFFNNFEKHLPIYRRILKLFIVLLVLITVGVFLGRIFFYGLLLLTTIGQIILHTWYFPKHGINGLTAEPYEEYLDLIEKMKNKKKGNRTRPQ